VWAIDGLANFLPYAGFPLLLFVPASILMRRRLLVAVAVVPFIAWLFVLATPQFFLTLAEDAPAGAPTLRVVTANVLMSNQNLDTLATEVLAEAPDVVVFQELTQDIDDFSPALAAAYPYRISTDTPWVTLASRFPLEGARVLAIEADDRGRDLLTAAVEVDGQRVTVIAVHLMPPLNGEAYRINAQQRALLEAESDRVQGPLVVLGDFNATTLSPTFAQLLIGTDLRIAAESRSIEPTYFAYGRLGVRIDHVLVRSLGIAGERVFSLTGSDHRGVAVELSLPPDSSAVAAAR